MIHVKLTTNFPDWPLLRQTPGGLGVWGECRFFVNEAVEDCDFWVVYDDLVQAETTRCPPGNTLLITGEPPSVKTYSPRFLAQFARVLTCQRGLKHRSLIHSQQALPWMVGCRYEAETNSWEKSCTKDYDALSAMPAMPKPKLLSVISSDKAFTPGHRQRLEFVMRLRDHFGDRIDLFGRGLRDVADKWDALAPYKYHVVIENSRYPDYWTEKLSDALLADAYPLYAGCPNIGDYFGENALTALDLSRPEAALEAITTAIQSGRYEATLPARQEAKNALLNRYNLFPTIERLVTEALRQSPPQALTLRPSQELSRTFLTPVKQAVRRWILPRKVTQ